MQGAEIPAGLTISLGEQILFWCLAVSMVIVAVYGLLIARKAVYTIISVIYVMVGLAFYYTMLEAPFMGVVQVVVYTGAILMMFLFILMLVGINSEDSARETLTGQRAVAVIGALGTLALLSLMLLKSGPIAKLADAGLPVGLEQANSESNPVAVAQSIITNHVLTLELTGTLLIVAALGAMTLTHADRVRPKKTQEQIAHEKMQAFTAKGANPGVLSNPGVYAESNSSTNPSLTAYGEPVGDSVNRVLHVRHQDRKVSQISPVTAQRIAQGQLPSGPSTYGKIGRAQTWGMPGEAAPQWGKAPQVAAAAAVAADTRTADAKAADTSTGVADTSASQKESEGTK